MLRSLKKAGLYWDGQDYCTLAGQDRPAMGQIFKLTAGRPLAGYWPAGHQPYVIKIPTNLGVAMRRTPVPRHSSVLFRNRRLRR